MRTTTALALLAVAAAHAAPAPPDAKAPPVTCTISGPPTVELGKAPTIGVELTNRTGVEVVLVGSLDGSDCRWRHPHCYFEVTGPDGKSAVRGAARCGTMNPLRAKDFVAVPAGKSFDPYQRVDDAGFFGTDQLRPETFARPGEYRVRFTYSTAGWKPEDGGKRGADGVSDETLRGLLGRVPRVTAVSNEITVKVVEPAGK